MTPMEIIRCGYFLYDGFHPTELRIVRSPIRYGTGDYEDPPEICNDIEVETYYIEYGSTYEKGVFVARGGSFDSATEAELGAAAAVGESLVWLDD